MGAAGAGLRGGVDQVGDGHRLVAVGAGSAEADAGAEDAAVGAALLAEVALAALGALVDASGPHPAGRRRGRLGHLRGPPAAVGPGAAALGAVAPPAHRGEGGGADRAGAGGHRDARGGRGVHRDAAGVADRVSVHLTESSLAATRKKDTYLGARYQRLRGRRGHSKALTAVSHSILTAAWHMLSTGETYREAGAGYYTRQNPDRATRALVRRLEALGHRVTIEPLEAAA